MPSPDRGRIPRSSRSVARFQGAIESGRESVDTPQDASVRQALGAARGGRSCLRPEQGPRGRARILLPRIVPVRLGVRLRPAAVDRGVRGRHPGPGPAAQRLAVRGRGVGRRRTRDLDLAAHGRQCAASTSGGVRRGRHPRALVRPVQHGRRRRTAAGRSARPGDRGGRGARGRDAARRARRERRAAGAGDRDVAGLRRGRHRRRIRAARRPRDRGSGDGGGAVSHRAGRRSHRRSGRGAARGRRTGPVAGRLLRAVARQAPAQRARARLADVRHPRGAPRAVRAGEAAARRRARVRRPPGLRRERADRARGQRLLQPGPAVLPAGPCGS